MRSVRVLVVDDSAVMRSLLRMVITSHPRLELAGMAQDGPAALNLLEQLKPDLVLLDIEMPQMNGLEVLEKIRERDQVVKVIMCSTLTRRGAGITMEALARGAADYVAKPSAQHGVREGLATLTNELIPKILAQFSIETKAFTTPPVKRVISPIRGEGHAVSAVVIGVSTGGPSALEKLLPALPADFPIPILIVQHMPQLFTALLAERLDSQSRVKVREAVAGTRPEAGTVDLARGDWHMEVRSFPEKEGCWLRLTQAAPEQSCRPSVDVLFRSAASAYESSVLGVILTGMGSDGLDGCRAIRAAGGTIFVQDQASSAVWGMPGAVAEAGLANRVLPLDAMASEIVRTVSQSRRSEVVA